jgi:hypothetical protein
MMRACFLLLGSCAGLTVAAAQSSYHSPQLFLEAWSDIYGSTQYEPVSDGKWVTISKYDLLTVATNDPNAERPSSVKLQFRVISNDAVSITATVLFGKFDLYEPSMRNMRSETVATHSFRVNDLVSFPELNRIGFSLLNYRLVPAQPDRPYRPRLESKAPSLTFDFAQIDRTTGKISVHNHSEKAVVALMVGNAGGGGGAQSEPGRTLIAPGATYDFDSSTPISGWCIGRVCGPEPLPLILRYAVFEDGSYEGDQIQAMFQVAYWFGHSAERKRIVGAARPIMSNPDFDESEKIHSLASVIDAVSIEPDEDTITTFRMRFSDLPAGEIQLGESTLAMNMGDERNNVKWRLQRREEDLVRKTHIFPSITEWWDHYAGR